MKVRLTMMGDGSILVDQLDVGGGSIGSKTPVIVQPSGSFNGWKHKRLRKLGEGVHDLVTKDQARVLAKANPPDKKRRRGRGGRKPASQPAVSQSDVIQKVASQKAASQPSQPKVKNATPG